MVETRSQKSSEGQKATLEVEFHPDPAMDENRKGHGPEGRGNRRLPSESTPVEQGQDFATSIRTVDREEMSELSDVSTENVATTRSSTDNTMMLGVTEKPSTSSSFSERVKNTFGNFFPFTMRTGTGDEAETQEEEEEDDEQVDFGSQVSLNSSTQKNDAYADKKTGTVDQLGVVRTISKTTNGSSQSGDFVTRAISEMRTEKNRNTGLCNAPADQEVDYEKTSRQRIRTQFSTSTKLPGTVDNGASIEEALTNIVGSIGEQNEQKSLRMSELERAVYVERETLREEINRNRQEVSRSEKRMKERTDKHLATIFSGKTREAEQRELLLTKDMEKLRSQQEQTLGILDTKIDAMMERRTQAIMDRLYGLLGSRSWSKNGESNSGKPSRKPRVNFNEQPNRRRTYGSTRGRGSSSSYATEDNRPRCPNIRGSSTGNRPTSNEGPTQDTHATGRCDSRNRSHANPGRSHPAIQTGGKIQSPYQWAMILKRGIQETLHQWRQPLNL